MDISVNKLLNKISEEVTEAKKASSEAKIRERARAIKAICELILEEPTKAEPISVSSNIQVLTPTPPITPSFQVSQEKKMEMDDEANGDSLFDF
jgi:hypothetical protein